MDLHTFITKADFWLCYRILRAADELTDRRICGQSLVKTVPSIFRDDKNGVGGTNTSPTRYIILNRIFSHVRLEPSDVFLDVGCGKGRVLAFLVKKKAPCRIYGIEHNEEVSRMAAQWAEKYDRLCVLTGDALQFDYDPYTVLFLSRPFLPKTFLAFLDRLEDTLTHPITFIYCYDGESGHFLEGRPGWEMRMRDRFTRIHGLKVARGTMSYSIWDYDPSKKQPESTADGQELL